MKRAFLIFLGLATGVFAVGDGVKAGWQAIADYQTDEALQIFTRESQSPDATVARAARFGRGVALLTKQPVTTSQVDEARKIFAELADGGTDEPAQAGRFFLARVAQHHQENPDPTEAARQFRQLIAEHENSVWAQSALSRLGLLQLYELDLNLSPAERVAEAEKLLLKAHAPTAEGELHIAIAEAIFFYRLPEQAALPHLLAAERLGGYDRIGRADVLVQIGELSRLAGKKEQAKKFYHLFLKENPRDTANYTVRVRLAELEGHPIEPQK